MRIEWTFREICYIWRGNRLVNLSNLTRKIKVFFDKMSNETTIYQEKHNNIDNKTVFHKTHFPIHSITFHRFDFLISIRRQQYTMNREKKRFTISLSVCFSHFPFTANAFIGRNRSPASSEIWRKFNCVLTSACTEKLTKNEKTYSIRAKLTNWAWMWERKREKESKQVEVWAVRGSVSVKKNRLLRATLFGTIFFCANKSHTFTIRWINIPFWFFVMYPVSVVWFMNSLNWNVVACTAPFRPVSIHF